MPFQFAEAIDRPDQQLLASFVPQLERFLRTLLYEPELYFKSDYQPHKNIAPSILEDLRRLFEDVLPNFRRLFETAFELSDSVLREVGLAGTSLRSKFRIIEASSISFLRDATREFLKKILGYANIILDSFGAAISMSFGTPGASETVKELKGFVEETFL